MQPKTESFRWFGRLLGLGVCLVGLCGAEGRAAARLSPEMTESQAGEIAMLFQKFLQQFNYRPVSDGPELAQEYLRRYLNVLDPWHVIFLQTDVDEFRSRWGDKLSDEVAGGKLQSPFLIYENFRKNYLECVGVALLQAEAKHDFSLAEKFDRGRSALRWPSSKEERNESWRLLVKSEILKDYLANHDWAQAIADVKNFYQQGSLGFGLDGRTDQILSDFLSAVGQSFDPHDEYYSPRAWRGFNLDSRSRMVGIGLRLSPQADRSLKITRIVPGSAAARSHKLHVGDRLLAIGAENGNFADVASQSFEATQTKMQGEAGSVLALKFSRTDASGTKTFSLRLRREIESVVEARAKARLIVRGDPAHPQRLGLISLPSFYVGDGKGQLGATDDVRKLVRRLNREGVQGLVIDLRDNPGGAVAEVQSLAALFTGGGPVYQQKDRQGEVEVQSAAVSAPLYRGPLVVLTNHQSASAAEIFAGVIQDYRVGVVVGAPSTWGKGSSQTVLDVPAWAAQLQLVLPAGDALGGAKITTARFYRLNGESSQGRGIKSDIVLPLISLSLAEGEDTLDHSLDPDRVRPAPYRALNLASAPILQSLRERSQARVQSNPEFQYMTLELERRQRSREKRYRDLNQQNREQRADAYRVGLEARYAERHAQRALEPVLWQSRKISMDDLDRPLAQLEIGALTDASPATEGVEALAADEANAENEATVAEGLAVLSDWAEMQAAAPLARLSIDDSPGQARLRVRFR